MTDKELKELRKNSNLSDLSPFAKFCRDTRGYSFETKNGYQVDKWEVFLMGYTNAHRVIRNLTTIKAYKNDDN